MENKNDSEKTNVTDIIYGIGIFLMLSIMTVDAVIWCLSDYK